MPDAYGVTIHAHVGRALGKPVSFGELYIALEALEAEYMISLKSADPTPERGHRPKLYAYLEIPGERALAK